MIGVIFVAFLVWKNATNVRMKMSKSSMQIEDSLNLAPRKNLFIIKIKNERFLIASDADKTTFLSKLEDDKITDFQDIQEEIIKEDIGDEITSQIKLKEDEEQEEPEQKQKPVNILQELVRQRGIN